MNRHRILLLGSTGQVGWELQRTLAPLGAVSAYGRNRLDLTDFDAVRRTVREEAPQLIVNAAAYTAVDRAEREPDLAHWINAEAPGLLAEEAKRAGAVLVHFSTDYVYDGTKADAYVESDAAGPLNVYGRTKLAGDEAIRAVGGPHLIFRTSWVYGTRGSNFLLTMVRLAQEREELRVVRDQAGCPTWSRWIAETVAQVLTHIGARDLMPECQGVYNLCGSGETSWYGFASAIVDHLKRVPDVPLRVQRVVPIASEEYPTAARRPGRSTLSAQRLAETFGIERMPWEDQLALCMADLCAAMVKDRA